jgi:hypothetical protein
MRLLVHRGQVGLLLVVGVLAGVAIVGICLELCGVAVPGPFKVTELFSQPSTPLPSQIVIGEGSGPVASPATATVALDPAQPALPQASPTTAVVPGAVYTYPPDSSGRGGRGRDGRGG